MPQTNPYSDLKHTDDINDIITAPPRWIIRWGNSLLFIVIALALVLSAVIRYPTVIKTTVKIKTTTAPITVAAKKAGYLQLILIANKQQVTAGKILGYTSSAGVENIPLIAPRPGRVMISPVLQAGSPLASGQAVFFIKPENEQFYGELEIAENQLANIKTGQQVLIKHLDNSAKNHGVIRGHISYIAELPDQSNVYICRVIFSLDDKGANNTQGQLKGGLKAEAEILTQDASVLQRVFWKLTSGITQP